MKRHKRISHTQFRAARPRQQPGRSRGSMKWIIIVAFCIALTVFLVALVSLARAKSGSAAALQKQPQQAYTASPDLPVQPAPTRQAGINNDLHQGPFLSSVFTVRNFWQGPVGNDWILAYAGAKPNPDGTTGQGGVVLYTETINAAGGFDLHPLGTFLAPAGYPPLMITDVQNYLMTVHSASRQTLTFNLQTHQFQ